jgi:hypothetical protein
LGEECSSPQQWTELLWPVVTRDQSRQSPQARSVASSQNHAPSVII